MDDVELLALVVGELVGGMETRAEQGANLRSWKSRRSCAQSLTFDLLGQAVARCAVRGVMTRADARSDEVDSLPRAYWVLFAASLVNRLGGFVVPFLALYLEGQRHQSVARVGSVIAIYGAGAVLSGPLGGLLADRLGRRRTVVLGLTLSAASMLHLAVASGGIHLALATLLMGLCSELSRPAQSAAVADLVAPALRARAYGYLYWAANLGFALASVVAGFCARSRFETLFVADAATSVLAALLVLWCVPETRPTTLVPRTESAARDVVAPFRDASFAAYFAASLLVALVFMQFQAAMPLDMRAHGITTPQYGLLAGLNGLLVVLLQPLVSRYALSARPGVSLAVGSLLTGAGFGLFGLVPSLPGYVAGIVVLTLGEVAMSPVMPLVVANLAPRQLRGSYQGAFQLAFSIPACVAPLLGSRILGSLGSGSLWMGCAVLATLGGALHFAIERPRARRLAAVTAAGISA